MTSGFRYKLTRTLALAAIAACSFLVALAAERTDDKFKTSDGLNLHYVRLGDSGSWVVLLHGMGDSAERMWITTGVAEALAKNHRVVALDCRNHGQSDKAAARGPGIPADVIELMDHLKIDKAHIHGYSMGGGLVRQLLNTHPERFITAGLGGSGVLETDPKVAAEAKAKDESLQAAALAARGAAGGAGSDSKGKGRGRGGIPTGTLPQADTIDFTKLDIPILVISGELDNPPTKTSRLSREAKKFTNIILPGHTHLTAIGVGGAMPEEFTAELEKFIDQHDAK